MQSNAESTRRKTSIVGPAIQAGRDAAGVFSVSANLLGARIFDMVEKFVEHTDSASTKLGLKDAEFMKAVRDGQVDRVRSLLAAGVNPLAPRATHDGWSPIHEMAARGDTAMLDVFLDHVRTSPDLAPIFNKAEHVDHRIAFQVALDNGHVAFAEQLLTAGHAHLASVDKEGRNGLSRLAYSGDIDLVQKAANKYGAEFIALHAESVPMAIQHEAILGGSESRVAFISMLQSFGVDLYKKNGPDGGSIVHSAANVGDTVVLQHILGQKTADIDATNRHGMTALHILAAHGRHALVQVFLDNKANPNAMSIHDPARNLVAATPLMLAAARGHRHTVDVLASDPRTRIGLTSQSSGLHAVEYARRNGHDQVAASMEDSLRRRLASANALEAHARITNSVLRTPNPSSTSLTMRPGR